MASKDERALAVLAQDAYRERLMRATTEAEPVFRWRAAFFLMALERENRIDVVLQMLGDEDPFVREKAGAVLISLRHPQIEGRLVEMVLFDPHPDVRAAACRGLAGQSPLTAIPILLRVMESDHASGENGWPVSHCAADALDEMMGSELMAKRKGSVCTFPDNPQNPEAVREHAERLLRELKNQGGGK